MSSAECMEILKFWFGESLHEYRSQLWWFNQLPKETKSGLSADEYIKQKWGKRLDNWTRFDAFSVESSKFARESSKPCSLKNEYETATRRAATTQSLDECMAHVILLDQFARHVYRNTPRAFEFESDALMFVHYIQQTFPDIPGPYRLFLGVALMHSECARFVHDAGKWLLRSVLDLKPPTNIITDEKERKKYMSVWKSGFFKTLVSAQQHLEVLLEYKRYPHRNAVLQRASTPAELALLESKKLPTWMKTLQTLDTATKKPISIYIHDTKTGTERVFSVPKKLQILVLHSNRQSVDSFKKNTKQQLGKLNDIAELTFCAAPHDYVYIPDGADTNTLRTELDLHKSSDTKSQSQSRLGQELDRNGRSSANVDQSGQRLGQVWWNASDDAATMVYRGMRDSIVYLDNEFKKKPYDGILGFSQGGAMAGVIAAYVERYRQLRSKQTVPDVNLVANIAKSLKFIVSISGFYCRDTTDIGKWCHLETSVEQPKAGKVVDLKPIMRTSKIQLPSFHIWGQTDVLVYPWRSKCMSDAFENPRVQIHDRDHYANAIRVWPIDAVKEWLYTTFLQDSVVRLDKRNDFVMHLFKNRLNEKETLEWMRANCRDQPAYFWPQLLAYDTEMHEKLLEEEKDGSMFSRVRAIVVELLVSELHNEWLLFTGKPPTTTVSDDLEYVDPHAMEVVTVKTGLSLEPNVAQYAPKYNSTYKKTRLVSYVANTLLKRIDIFKDWEEESVKARHSFPSDITTTPTENKVAHAYFIGQLKSQDKDTKPDTKTDKDSKSDTKTDTKTDTQVDDKRHYHQYQKMVSLLCKKKKEKQSTTETKSESKRSETIQTRRQLTLAEMIALPVHDAILNPKAEPVEMATREAMSPLYTWLNDRKTAELILNSDQAFEKGTVCVDGRLDLCKQAIGKNGIYGLLKALRQDSLTKCPKVTSLLLGNNLCGDELAESVGEFIQSGKSALNVWYIAGNDLTLKGVRALTDALEHDKKVTQLWLKRNPLMAQSMPAFTFLFHRNTALKVLDLTNTGLLDMGAIELLTGLKSAYHHNPECALEYLYLAANALTENTCKTLIETLPYLKKLKQLSLGCNRLKDAGARHLAKALVQPGVKLESLEIASCAIGPDGVVCLADALVVNRSVVCLNMGHLKSTLDVGEVPNFVEPKGAIALAQMLRTNTTLKSLDLTYTRITESGMHSLSDTLLKENKTLVFLSVEQGGIPLNELTKESIRMSIQRNQKYAGEQEVKRVQNIRFPPHLLEIQSVYRVQK